MAMRSSGRRTGLGLLTAAVLAGCGGSATAPLIDIPELGVVTSTVPRGDLVQLELTNTTTSEVILPAPVCTTRLELFSQGAWFAVPATNPDCVGMEVALAIGANHRFGIPAPTSPVGRYRAVVSGSNGDGQFVVRSGTFTVE